jgi:hypothetical protein
MPPLTRWFIRSSFVYLVAALLVGVAQAAPGAVQAAPVVAVWGPVYVHLLTVGWITQMIFGVAYWMFPRYSRAAPRGSAALGVAAYGLLNAGLLLRVVGEPAATLHPGGRAGWLLAAAAALQWLGGAAFVVNTWPRVKER